MTDSQRSGCFRYGCIGCGVLVALFVGVVILLGAVTMMSDHTPRPEEATAEHRLPEPPGGIMPLVPPTESPEAPTPPTFDGEPSDAPTPDSPPTVEIAPSVELLPAPPESVGTLELDLAYGDFTLVPGPANEPLRVEAEYDANRFQLVEDLETTDDGGWTYRVDFGAKGGMFGLMMRGGSGPVNRVRIVVPRGHPLRIVGSAGIGEVEMDLGGLWLEDVDLELKMGEHFIEFSEPTPLPMGRFVIDGRMGEIELRRLGDASPREVVVSHRMGESLLDLQGAWRGDSKVDASFRMGEMRVWLPETARSEILRSTVGMGEARTERAETELPDSAPLVVIDASGSMGELSIER
ncbi:MAG: hypothetical protein AAGC60_30570 [Acidobacteriota bacterium]